MTTYACLTPVSNLSFLSKVIEKVISPGILEYILDNNIFDSFQSASMADHSCETLYFVCTLH